MSIDEFLTLENEPGTPLQHVPDVSDACVVRWMLCLKRLPVELALLVMKLAEYEPRRRLKIPHDPLHWENRDELMQYLTYCWQTLVRCDMMAKELDMKMCWEDMVAECVVQLLDVWHGRYFWDAGSKMDKCRLQQWWKDQGYRVHR